MAFTLGPKAISRGYRLAAYETIGSTSSEALERGRTGDPGRLWVVAKEQTAGHGRRGRPWQTPGGNLAASLLIALPGRNTQAATLGFAAGLALEGAIRDCAALSHRERVAAKQPGEGLRQSRIDDEVGSVSNPGLASHPLARRLRRHPLPMGEGSLRLKWPNDVLIDGAKVAGILLEAVTVGDRNIVAVGIGVNVRHGPEGQPYPATSLAACGSETTPEVLFEALAENWVEQEDMWNGGRGFATIRDRWLDRAAGLGAPIAVQSGEAVLRGTFETIDDEGRLVVRAPDGSARTISAGEVHFGAAATAAS